MEFSVGEGGLGLTRDVEERVYSSDKMVGIYEWGGGFTKMGDGVIFVGNTEVNVGATFSCCVGDVMGD